MTKAITSARSQEGILYLDIDTIPVTRDGWVYAIDEQMIVAARHPADLLAQIINQQLGVKFEKAVSDAN